MAIGRLYKSRLLVRGEGPQASAPFLVLPIDHLDVNPVPYTGQGTTTVELFDGREVFRPPQFKHTVELRWDYLTDTEAERLDKVIRHTLGITVPADLSANLTPTTGNVAGAVKGVTHIYFDEGNLTRVLQVIPRFTDGMTALMYNKRTRRKPARIEFVTTTPTIEPPPSWLTV